MNRPAPVSDIPIEMSTRGPQVLAALPATNETIKKVADIGSSSLPARVAVSASTAWRNRGSTNKSPYMPNVISVASANAAEKALPRKMLNGTSGLADRCSTSRNAHKPITDSAKQLRMGQVVKPHLGPS